MFGPRTAYGPAFTVNSHRACDLLHGGAALPPL